MRTGPAVLVQRGDFVIAGGSWPFESLTLCRFANELLAGEPENLRTSASAMARSGIVNTSRISLLFGEAMIGFCPARLASSLPISGGEGDGTLRGIPVCSNNARESTGQNS